MIRIGEFEITRIPEIEMRGEPSLFRDWDDAAIAALPEWLSPTYYDPGSRTYPTSIHAFLVRSPDALMLIDAGCGNGKPRPAPMDRFGMLDTPFLARLEAAGARPEDLTHVIFTHLHVDHVGWATVKDGDGWRLTFPQALHVMTRTERDAKDPERGARGQSEARTAPFLDSVKPVLDEGRVALVEGDERDFLPGLDFMPTPGHAAGQMAVRLRSGGEEALFVADVMHQPFQVFHPGWSSGYCEDKARAAETRAKVLDYAAGTGALILPGHFAGTHCGYVRRAGSGFVYAPSDEAP